MGTYNVKEAIELWRVGTLTSEQAIGQLLQFIREDRERMNEIERWLKRVERATQSPERSGRGEARGAGRELTPPTRPALNATRDAPDE